jgi:beta-glucosidase
MDPYENPQLSAGERVADLVTRLSPGEVSGLVGDFGASDAALMDALTGRLAPRGRLPVELPRSMDAVRASRPAVPSDTVDPLYPYGAGLTC